MKKRKTLYSFDIFDTLITRAVVKPSDIHSIVQQKILSDVRFSNVNSYFKHDFSIIRKEYENYCRENSMLNDNGYDISLNDIYKEIQINYNLPENITNEIKSIEIETEYNNILPIDKNIKKLKELLKNGEKVILISDMYLDSNTIRSFLLKVDNIFQNIEIYVSSEYKKSKYNGSLYRMIKNKYNKYNNFIHYGDNKFSDILQAKWNKIQPIKIKPIALKPVEKYLSEKYNNIEILLPIGVSRYLREQCSTSDTYNFGVSIAAPFLYNYVDWILHDAINRGFKHLYFVARDGYILKLIADEIIKIQNFNIQTHYFYSSRRVTRIPNKNNIDFFKQWLINTPKVSSPMTPLLIEQYLGIPVGKLKTIINFRDKKSILSLKTLNQLIKDPIFEKLLIDCNIEKQDLLIKYLKQEIDFSKEDFAFVDINGTGKTQDILANIIAEFYPKPIYYYYFHNALNCKQSAKSVKLSFIKSKKYYLGMILELFCRNRDGQTIGYKQNDNKIEPIIETIDTKYFDKWHFDDYIKGVLDYTKFYQNVLNLNNLSFSSIAYNIAIIDYLQNHMDKKTANILGQVAFSEYNDEMSIKECAPKNCFLPLKLDFTFKEIQYKRSDFPWNLILKFWYFITKKTNYGYISKKRNIAYVRLLTKKINIRELIFKDLD